MPTPLDAKLPPPIAMLLLCVAMMWLARSFPFATVALPLNMLAGACLVVAGFAFNIAPKMLFAQARTTANPMRPASSAALVTSGLYRFTRNPMYLGHTMILLGYGCFLSNAYAFSMAPLYVAYITVFQILPEERALSARFGAQYDAYRRQVRRWL